MKKIFLAIITVIICLTLSISAYADDSTPNSDVLESVESIDTEATVETEPEADAEDTVPSDKIKEDNFLSAIDNEAIDKIIALGKELKELKESDYTFEERMLQLINSENLSSTIGTIATVVASIAIFIFRSIQKRDSLLNAAKIKGLEGMVTDLEDLAELEKNEIVKLKEDIKTLIDAISTNTEVLNKINIDTTENRHNTDVAKTATIATAKMVSDAFGHSRTIDAPTKALITYDYLEVLKADGKNNDNSNNTEV